VDRDRNARMIEQPWPSPRVAWYAVGVLTVAYIFFKA
jgi:hypothetical protein